jgi:peptide deformylase
MAIRPIIIAPDPRLKKHAQPVESVDAAMRRLMDDMLETMYAAPGVGLAAPQVGILKRIIVVDAARKDEPPEPLFLANPELLWAAESGRTYEEGCLSLPDQFADVIRPEACRVRYLDRDNKIREIEAEGILATCIQHEMDHLEGLLFVDHISALKRNIILRRLSKQKKADKSDVWIPKLRPAGATVVGEEESARVL